MFFSLVRIYVEKLFKNGRPITVIQLLCQDKTLRLEKSARDHSSGKTKVNGAENHLIQQSV